jgi:hypothetical protein
VGAVEFETAAGDRERRRAAPAEAPSQLPRDERRERTSEERWRQSTRESHGREAHRTPPPAQRRALTVSWRRVRAVYTHSEDGQSCHGRGCCRGALGECALGGTSAGIQPRQPSGRGSGVDRADQVCSVLAGARCLHGRAAVAHSLHRPPCARVWSSARPRPRSLPFVARLSRLVSTKEDRPPVHARAHQLPEDQHAAVRTPQRTQAAPVQLAPTRREVDARMRDRAYEAHCCLCPLRL